MSICLNGSLTTSRVLPSHPNPLRSTGVFFSNHPSTYPPIRHIFSQARSLYQHQPNITSLRVRSCQQLFYPAQYRSLSNEAPFIKPSQNNRQDNRKDKTRSSSTSGQGSPIVMGSSKILDSYNTYENKPKNSYNKYYQYVGGGTAIVLIILLAGLYLYCEQNPDEEVCASIRSKLGIKKK